MSIQFVVYDTNQELIERLKAQISIPPFVRYVLGSGLRATAEAKLDALKISWMSAVDRLGANPPFPIFEAIVIKTPSAEIQRGLPRYMIAGVAVPKNHIADPRGDLELVVSALLRSIREFNSKGEDEILRVGILPNDLCFDKLPDTEIFQIIERIYGEVQP
jgi:hypothetical protein